MFNTIAYIAESVATWPLLMVGQHRFGGLEFTLETREVGHIYESGLLDIPLTRRLSLQLIAEGKAEPHYLYPDSGWISFPVSGKAAVHHALWLLRFSYLEKLFRIRRTAPSLLAGMDLMTEIHALNLSDSLLANFTE